MPLRLYFKAATAAYFKKLLLAGQRPPTAEEKELGFKLIIIF